MKKTLGAAVANSGILGAKLVRGQASSSSSAVGSSTASSTLSSSSRVSTSISSNFTSTAPSPIRTASGLPKRWSYQGCWIDNAHGPILQNRLADNSTMTIESCSQACVKAGFAIAGLEYTSQCSCGNTVIDAGTLAAQDSDCAMPCGGNAAEICGGPNRMSLYSGSKVKVLGVPVPQNASLPGSWQYAGCRTDNVPGGGHVLPWQLILPKNEAASCLSQCSAFGYMVGGMEYG